LAKKARWPGQRAAPYADALGEGTVSGGLPRKRFRAKPRDLPAAFQDDLPGLGDLIPLGGPGDIRIKYQYERLIDELSRIDAGAPRGVDFIWLACAFAAP
jgi:hypothetical protein